MAFNPKPEAYALTPTPSLDEFGKLWAAWDLVTRWMIPEKELLSKPIKLRNCCLFYLGHIPAFLDIHLARATDGILTEPASYRQIFERGIDPDVENPELCHAHSEVCLTVRSVRMIKSNILFRFQILGLRARIFWITSSMFALELGCFSKHIECKLIERSEEPYG